MYIGIDIGGTKCSVIKAEEDGVIIKKHRFETSTYTETLNCILKKVKEMGPAKAIGISCGGPLDTKRGIILSPPNLVGWDHVEITSILEAETGIKTYLQNDANACALAEWKYGAGRGCENMVFLTFGTGLGAGIIVNNRLYEGAGGMAGELGHIRLSENGPVGYGKSGSFEGFCSGGGLAQLGKIKAMELIQMGKHASFCRSYEELEEISAKKIAECAFQGNQDAISVYEACGYYLGKGLSIVIDLLNPERIVLGSIFSRAEGLLRHEMEAVLKSECLASALHICKIIPAMLGECVGDMAAISVAVEGERGCL